MRILILETMEYIKKVIVYIIVLVFLFRVVEAQNISEIQITGKYIIPDGPRWVNNAVFYQIYPQTYYDSDGDGIGDLNGIIMKLDYVKSLGVNAIWLNPL
jgi:maltose alpha-D-glucosyltransferase/alpha-amylase